MKNSFRFLVAAVLVSLGATSFAQCVDPRLSPRPVVLDLNRGCYVMQGTPSSVGSPVYNGMPQMVYNPYYGVPQPYYGTASGFSTPTIIGGILGGTIGSLAKHHTGQAVIGGTILGGIVGSLFSSNGSQRAVQSVPAYYPQSGVVAGPTIPAEQWVGGSSGTVTVTRTVVRRESNCSVDGNSKLQNLGGLMEEQCAEVAKLTKASTSTTTASAAPSVASAPQAPRDNKIHACKLQRAPDTPVLAVSVPDPNNPSWKLEPSKPGETCQEWKTRISPSLD